MLIMISSHPLQRVKKSLDCLLSCLVYLRREISVDIIGVELLQFLMQRKVSNSSMYTRPSHIREVNEATTTWKIKTWNWNISTDVASAIERVNNVKDIANRSKKEKKIKEKERIAYKSFDFCVTQDKNMKQEKCWRHIACWTQKKPEIPSTQRGMKSNVVLFMDAISSFSKKNLNKIKTTTTTSTTVNKS